jgi:hypothetical protein
MPQHGQRERPLGFALGVFFVALTEWSNTAALGIAGGDAAAFLGRWAFPTAWLL